jgi:CheY-like chemotaxis protein
MLKQSLEDLGGFDVVVENDSRKALSVARTLQPTLILCDVVMPGMDGGDVVARIRHE